MDVVEKLIDEERRGRKEERWERRNARLLNASEYRAKRFTELRSQPCKQARAANQSDSLTVMTSRLGSTSEGEVISELGLACHPS